MPAVMKHQLSKRCLSKRRPRCHKLTVMLSDEEHEALKRQAESDGLSVADIVRQAIRTVPSFEAIRTGR